jgi:hypothetical protein
MKLIHRKYDILDPKLFCHWFYNFERIFNVEPYLRLNVDAAKNGRVQH